MSDKEHITGSGKDTQAAKSEKVRRIPWWVTILAAIVVYCTLKYLLPELNPSNPTLQDLFAMGPVVAPVLTIPFLLLGAKQLYDVDLPGQAEEEKEREE